MYTAESVKAAKPINASWKSSLKKSCFTLFAGDGTRRTRAPVPRARDFRFFDAVRNTCDRNVARYDDFNKYPYVGDFDPFLTISTYKSPFQILK